MRLGALEDVTRSEGEEIGLRLFVGSRSASVSSSDLSADALAALVERAAAMAREAPEDPYSGLAPEERLLKGPAPDVEADDGADPSPVALRRGRWRSRKRRAPSPASPIRKAPASAPGGRWWRWRPRTASAAAMHQRLWRGGERDRRRGRRHAARQRQPLVRHYADLDAPEAIGRLAGERTVARLNPGKLASGTMPILFDPRVGGSLIGACSAR